MSASVLADTYQPIPDPSLEEIENSSNEISIQQYRPLAVIDTGMDLTHPDLVSSIRRNPKEIPSNNVDDDENGKVDDVIGWDFFREDGIPFDTITRRKLKWVNPFVKPSLKKTLDSVATAISNVGKLGADLIEFGQDGHGTHVTGIILKQCPEAEILPLKVRFGNYRTNTSVVAAMKYAVERKAVIVNMSLGFPVSTEEIESYQVIQEMNEIIINNPDVLFVVAAGNDGVSLKKKPFYPAVFNHQNVITVGALDDQTKEKTRGHLRMAFFSNYHRKFVDVFAPGFQIESTWLNGEYKVLSGTSMAAPFVSGVLYKMYLKNPKMVGKKLRNRFIRRVAKRRWLYKFDEEDNYQFRTRLKTVK